MSTGFGVAVVMYALGVATACGLTALRGTRGPLIVPALIVVEAGLLGQAALDIAHLAGGPRPAELATHLGYLAASIAVIPIAAGSVRLDEGRWGTAALAVGCIVAAVVSVRLHQTLAPAARG